VRCLPRRGCPSPRPACPAGPCRTLRHHAPPPPYSAGGYGSLPDRQQRVGAPRWDHDLHGGQAAQGRPRKRSTQRRALTVGGDRHGRRVASGTITGHGRKSSWACPDFPPRSWCAAAGHALSDPRGASGAHDGSGGCIPRCGPAPESASRALPDDTSIQDPIDSRADAPCRFQIFAGRRHAPRPGEVVAVRPRVRQP